MRGQSCEVDLLQQCQGLPARTGRIGQVEQMSIAVIGCRRGLGECGIDRGLGAARRAYEVGGRGVHDVTLRRWSDNAAHLMT